MVSLQKASMWKRISAFLFDGILLGIVAVLFALFFSALFGYDSYPQKVNDIYARYEEEYQVNLRPNIEEFEAMDEETLTKANTVIAIMNQDEEAQRTLNLFLQMTILIATFGLLMSFLAMEFMIPMIFKNGQTLGKKIFGIAVMHTSGIKLNGPMLFARVVLGKFAVETMVPVYILIMMLFGSIGIAGPAVLILLLILQAGVMIGTHTNSMIHDLLAKTVTVDFASQRIFENQAALLSFKEQQHAEKVSKESY